ncbi:MAG TPA: HigA family addiction module antitoxin [Chthonomonadaceae bacterium]|nr:HigA family addiction module antitoxin [Chthonomonadaceae bacterium]
MVRLENVHPGQILLLDFLKPLNITPYKLAKAIGVQQTRISEIIRGECSITLDAAIRLGRYFNMSPQFWLNLQNHYDLEALRLGDMSDYENIHPCEALTAA